MIKFSIFSVRNFGTVRYHSYYRLKHGFKLSNGHIFLCQRTGGKYYRHIVDIRKIERIKVDQLRNS